MTIEIHINRIKYLHHTYVFLPMKIEGRMISVLIMKRTENNSFSAKSLHYFSSCATNTINIDNMFHSSQRKTQR